MGSAASRSGNGATIDAAALAEELRAAEPGDGFVPLFTERFAGFGWPDARAIALARDALRRADGDLQIGYKLGWTSSAMREALGIDRPNWGTLWESQRLGPVIDVADYRHPKVEPELVYVAGRELRGSIGREDVVAACAGWAVGLELVDPRFVDFGFGWLDNTADNSSAAGVAIGSIVEPPESDPADWAVDFGDGSEARSGIGDVVMGSPIDAVTWLVRSLDEIGEGLTEGMIVFTGGIAAPFDVVAGNRYRAGCGELPGQVGFQAN